MTEEKKIAENTEKIQSSPQSSDGVKQKKDEAKKIESKSIKIDNGKKNSPDGGKKQGGFKKNKRGGFKDREKDEFEQKIVDIARVTRVMAGGKRMRFRACVAIGDKKGRVGIGLGKGIDVTIAVNKAVNVAKKNLVNIPIVNDTIPHEIYQKIGAAKILFKPARKGRGIIAGGAVRIVLELSGIKNITSKILGTSNQVNNVKCAIEALKSLKRGSQNAQKNTESAENKNNKK